MPLILHTSNRLELLVERLAELAAAEPLPPFAAETVVVQSRGMARWLALTLAERHRVCANLACPFPATFVWRLFEALGRPVASLSPFEGDAMIWAVMDRLEALLATPAFAPLASYLAADARALRRYQLAARIADTFDQYLIYRPDWIRSWEAGEGDHWQAVLWRALYERHGGDHRANLLFELLSAIDHDFVQAQQLPRLALFGIPALPLAHFEVFARLAEAIDVHIFLLNPCRRFWEDLVSRRRMARITLRHAGRLDDLEELHYEAGNELLASLGKLGQDFQRVIHSYDCHEDACFAEPGCDSLLAAVQTDILNGVDRRAGDRLPVPEGDRSLMIHAAHSPMREVEILYDRLLALFAADPGLEPRDVLVMAADIDRYAPYIEAVFSTPEEEPLRIPFSIADRSAVETSPVIRPFVELLRLAGSRLTVGQVLPLLDAGPVRQRFGIGEDELPALRRWLRETGIHWGIDADHRAGLGLAPTDRGTWAAGLDRLLLGYALPGGGHDFFNNILPYDAIEGGAAELLGRFAAFLGEVFAAAADFVRPRSLVSWRDDLLALAERFLAVDDELEDELQMLRDALHELARSGEVADFAEPVAIEAVAAHLASGFSGRGREGRFLAGQVTFCRMVPMRSIPFKVICLLGMDDGVFPRIDRPAGFDLMAEDFRIGDRSRRDDDRYLFLEALLSARDCFYLSFVGQSIRDNSERPPSVVVSELIDTIDRGFAFASGSAADNLVVRHPLQPFSPEYFAREGAASFSRLNHRLARTFPGRATWPGIFAGHRLAVDEERPTLSVAEFIDFFKNPARSLLRRRFGLLLDDAEEELVDRERFSLDALSRYQLRDELVAEILAGRPAAELAAVHRAPGTVPEGDYGDLDFAELAAEAEAFAARLEELRGSGPAGGREVPVELDLGRIHLSGRLEVHAAGQFLYRPTLEKRMNLADTVRHWLSHLLLNAVAPAGVCRTTWFVLSDAAVGYGPMDDAMALLHELADWYRQGLAAPLPLLPKASMAYATRLWGAGKRVEVPQALREARKIWQQGDYLGEPERNSPWFRVAFGDSDPVATPEFTAAAGLLRPALERRDQGVEPPAGEGA